MSAFMVKKKVECSDWVMDQFEAEFLWFPLRKEWISIEIGNYAFIFTDTGFVVKEKDSEIEYLRSEMSSFMKDICVRLIPQFLEVIQSDNATNVSKPEI